LLKQPVACLRADSILNRHDPLVSKANFKMAADYSRVDFGSVQEQARWMILFVLMLQAVWVCNGCDATVISRFVLWSAFSCAAWRGGSRISWPRGRWSSGPRGCNLLFEIV
jgi:hypothetical protein